MDVTRRPALGASRLERAPGTDRWLGAAAGVLLAALTLEVIAIALTSPRFAVRRVEVRGDPRVARLVADRIVVPAGANILRAPLDDVRRQAEGEPAVREAVVSRAFPNRIVVTVERREAVAVIRQGDRAVLVAPDGVPFTAPQESGWGLPELEVPHLGAAELAAGKGASEIEALLKTLRALGPDPRLRPGRLRLGRDGRVELTLDSGALVNLGEPTRLEAKVKFLALAIEQLGSDRIQRLDLSDPAAAHWEPRAEKGSGGVR